jgi:hypothetical protein
MDLMTALSERMRAARSSGKASAIPIYVLGLTLIASCSALPEVKPFADATANLATAVSSAGTPVEQLIANSFDPDVPETKSAAAQRASAFKLEWERRCKVVDEFSRYADGLSAVVQAGNHGEAAAKQVTTQFKQLLDIVRVPSAGLAVDAVATAAQKIYGEYAKHQAAKTLATQVNLNQPYVRELADSLDSDWQTLRDSFIDAAFDELITDALTGLDSDRSALAAVTKTRTLLRVAILKSYESEAAATCQELVKLQDDRRANAARLAEFDALYAQVAGDPRFQARELRLAELQDQRAELFAFIDQARTALLKAILNSYESEVAATFPELVKLQDDRRANAVRLAEFDALYTQVAGDPRFQAREQRLVELQDHQAELFAFIDQARLVTRQWEKSHGDLAVALQERRGVSFGRLLKLSEELLELYEKVRDE